MHRARRGIDAYRKGHFSGTREAQRSDKDIGGNRRHGRDRSCNTLHWLGSGMQDKLILNIKPSWDEIEQVRNTCGDFLHKQNMSQSVIDAITMVTSELVENAIKYGTFGETESVGISITVSNRIIIVEVRNPIDATGIPYLRHLDETIQWIRGYQDPFESYIIKLRQISTKSLHDPESGLGLVRISFEGRSILDFYVNENNILNVSAVYNY